MLVISAAAAAAAIAAADAASEASIDHDRGIRALGVLCVPRSFCVR